MDSSGDTKHTIETSLRPRYITLYLLILLCVGSGALFALYTNYSKYTLEVKNELLREANITNTQIETTLIDAKNLLDLTLPKIEQDLNAGKLTDQSAYKILQENRKQLSLFISDEGFMLTLYVDESGMLRATSQKVFDEPIDLSDRLYFQKLKNDSKKTVAVGNLVVARTTDLLTFHIAIPITDKSGKFRGILAQQLAAQDIESNLEKSLDGITDAQILVHIGGGNIAFNYPKLSKQSQADEMKCLHIHELILAHQTPFGVIETSSSQALPDDSYISYATSKNYDLETIVILSKKDVLFGFIKENLAFLISTLLVIFSLSVIMWRFYRNAVEMDLTLEMSYTDGLTQLKNRRAFDVEFPRLWKDAMRTKQSISALFIDIDHFKVFNDDYGHECGDIALKAVADAIQRSVSRPLDICCRWGGEEFAVVLPNTTEHSAISLADGIMKAVRSIRFDFPCDKRPKISVSIGIASTIVREENQTDDLIDMADKAMYLAKQAGRDRYALYSPGHSQ